MCHRGFPVLHVAPCCTPTPQEQLEIEMFCEGIAKITSGDVHAYRKAIADDCVVGVCSMNNCLYPDCSPKDRKLAVPMIFDKAHGQ
jgi:hypothetical protein